MDDVYLLQSEVSILGKLSHPNLVKLLGYCHEGMELLLVYEFMAKGSLESHLFTSKALIHFICYHHIFSCCFTLEVHILS